MSSDTTEQASTESTIFTLMVPTKTKAQKKLKHSLEKKKHSSDMAA